MSLDFINSRFRFIHGTVFCSNFAALGGWNSMMKIRECFDTDCFELQGGKRLTVPFFLVALPIVEFLAGVFLTIEHCQQLLKF